MFVELPAIELLVIVVLPIVVRCRLELAMPVVVLTVMFLTVLLVLPLSLLSPVPPIPPSPPSATTIFPKIDRRSDRRRRRSVCCYGHVTAYVADALNWSLNLSWLTALSLVEIEAEHELAIAMAMLLSLEIMAPLPVMTAMAPLLLLEVMPSVETAALPVIIYADALLIPIATAVLSVAFALELVVVPLASAVVVALKLSLAPPRSIILVAAPAKQNTDFELTVESSAELIDRNAVRLLASVLVLFEADRQTTTLR